MGIFSSVLQMLETIDKSYEKVEKQVIKLGKWNDNPIEWVILKEEPYGYLVICKDSIGAYRFDGQSNEWASSELCKFLNTDFYNKAFDKEEKKCIVNVRLSDDDNVKNNVFILTQKEVQDLLLKDGPDEYEDSHYSGNYYNCSGNGYYGRCNDMYKCRDCVWTRTKGVSDNCVKSGYAKNCWSNGRNVTSNFQVRPAMYLKK